MATRTLGINAAANITKTPKSVMYTLAELMNDVVALANELRTDHATTKVTVDLLETLCEELAADHATQKTLNDELIVDHATFKTAVDGIETLIEELHDDAATQRTLNVELIADHATFKTVVDELVTDHATTKVTVDQMETLIEELAADHATQKTLDDELIVDHAAFKVTVDQIETLIEELAADHATQKTLDDELILDHAAFKTVVDELVTDHATTKVTVDQMETLIEELAADHATQKTLDDELILDHASFKTSVDSLVTLATELRTDHDTEVTWATEVDADEDVMNNILDSWNQDGVIGGSFTIAGAAAVTLLGAGFVEYRIGGQKYYADLDTTITLTDSGDIIQNKYGAWRILIDRLGVVTTQDTGAQMAWDSAEIALLRLSAVAPTANTAVIGYFTVTDSGAGGFNIGTTNTTGGTATGVVYTVRGPQKRVTGLTAALGAATAVGGTNTHYLTGTKDVELNGLRVAQIAAEADKAFDNADTIGQSQYGGWLVVTNLAKSATYSLSATGAAGAVSAMTYASAALAQAAVGLREDYLPPMFCPISRIIILNNLAGLWTANTDDLAGTDGTATFTDCTCGTWDRTVTTGLNSHQVTPPTVPASITADLVAAITAVAPTAGPATLTATAPATLTAATAITSGPATLTAAAPATLTATAPATLTAATAITSGPATLTATAPATLTAATAITSGPATLTAAAPATLTATAPATLGTAKPASGPATLTATAPATLTATTAITSGPAALSAAAVDDISFREIGAP